MATIGTIRIAMSADTSPLKKGLDSAADSVQSFSAKITYTSSLLQKAWAGLIGGAAVTSLYKFANAAAGAGDAVAKMRAVFEGEADGIVDLAQKMAKGYGLSINAMYDEAGNLGSLFRGAGFDETAVAKFSDSFMRVANDMVAFNGGNIEEAFFKLKAGLIGSAIPLQSYGIFLSEAAVKARAYEMGIAKVGEELNETQKVQARANIILEKAGPAIGQADREYDAASSSINRFWGQLDNLKVTLGETFAPGVGAMLGGFSTSIAAMASAWADATTAISDWASGAVESLGLTLEPFNVLEVAIGGIANACQYVQIAFKALQTVVTVALTGMIKDVGLLARGLNYVYESITGAESGMADFLDSIDSFGDSMWESTKEQAQEVADAWNSPAWSNVVSDRFQQVRDEAAALRAELANRPIDIPLDVGKSEGLADGKGANPNGSALLFGSALRFGSAEATSAVLRNRFGSGPNDVEANTKRTADGVDRVAATLREIAGGLKGAGALSVADLS